MDSLLTDITSAVKECEYAGQLYGKTMLAGSNGNMSFEEAVAVMLSNRPDVLQAYNSLMEKSDKSLREQKRFVEALITKGYEISRAIEMKDHFVELLNSYVQLTLYIEQITREDDKTSPEKLELSRSDLAKCDTKLEDLHRHFRNL